jgi:hypothetical protein
MRLEYLDLGDGARDRALIRLCGKTRPRRNEQSIVFFIEHSVSSLHGTLANLEPMREGQLRMHNARHAGFKTERRSTNRFNDSEYKRWSERLMASRSFKTQSGIDTFLSANENLQTRCEDISAPSMKISDKMTRTGHDVLWKPRAWKRAAEQLRNRCRLLVEEFYSAVANQETRIVRVELSKLRRWAKSPWGC